jgi:thiamine kinase
LVPGCEAGAEPLAVAVLAGGGQLNRCLRVDTRQGRFVVRTRVDQAQRPGADGAKELLCQRAAAAAGLAPRVLASSPDASWLVMEFIDGALWQVSDLSRRVAVERLGEQLARLHTLAVPGLEPLDPMAIVNSQVELILKHDPAAYKALQVTVREASELAQACSPPGGRAVLNHGDLNAANLIGPRPVLVDWEYAQLADPLYDVACLLTYYPQLQGHLDWLLGAAALEGEGPRRVLDAHLGLFALFNLLWAQAQGGAHGDVAGLVAARPAE